MNTLNFDLNKLDEERNKHCTGENFRAGFKVFKGYTLAESFQFIQKTIEDFEVYDDDIWITSFPKCGTTWTQEMVWCIVHNLDYETAKVDLDYRMPFIEFCCVLYAPNDNFKEYDPDGIVRKSIERAKNAPRPRIIKTHLPFELLPKQIQTFEKKPRIIHIYRNIKDACVSYYYHNQFLEGYTGDFDLFWKLFLTAKLVSTPMVDVNLSYWNHRDNPNIMILRFEDMKHNLPNVLQQVSRYLNKSFTNSQIDELANYLSFDSMQNNKYIKKDGIAKYIQALGCCINKSGSFMRSGKTGGYKSLITPDIEEVFDNYLKEKLKNTSFKYD